MPKIKIESGSDIANEQYAIIYAPGRSRDRFPENCVTTVKSKEEAMAGVVEGENFLPAKVVGPCRSSEGFMIYYLVEWLYDK